VKAAPWAALARAIYGLTLLAAPDALLHRLSRHEADEITRVLTRLLGARLLIQTALIPPNSSPRRLRVGATIDTSHALTLIILATRSRKWRRLAAQTQSQPSPSPPQATSKRTKIRGSERATGAALKPHAAAAPRPSTALWR